VPASEVTDDNVFKLHRRLRNVNVRITREQFRPTSTIGRLFVESAFECFTLEDGVGARKIAGETAIPAGTYRVTIEHSPKFNAMMPRLHDVPGFIGILIHVGNTPTNTDGCILVGRTWEPGAERIGESRLAFTALKTKLSSALDRGEGVEITIVQPDVSRELATRAFPHRKTRRTQSKPHFRARL